jgi:biotin--protein ligase
VAAEMAPILAQSCKKLPEDPVNGSAAIGSCLVWADEIDSTQLVPRRIWGNSPPHGTVVAARVQNQGRGRSCNQWSSPEGCLMFTTVLRAPLAWGLHMPLLQHAMAVAAVEGVNAALRTADAPLAVQARIKWPNDIYLSNGGPSSGPSEAVDDDAPAKVGGILCQSEFDSVTSTFVLCVGIGLNVYDTPPFRSLGGYLGAKLASVQGSATFTPPSKACVLGHVLSSLQGVWNDFEGGSPGTGGNPFQRLLPRYLALWLHSGQAVVATDPVASRSKETSSGDATGTSEDVNSLGTPLRIFSLCGQTGALLATEDLDAPETQGGVGPVWSLHPDGNSLDMMQGLLKHKR